MVHLVILAAGASRRLGQPKALAQLPKGKPIVRLVEAARVVFEPLPTVVTGRHHAEIASALATHFTGHQKPYEIIHNQNWLTGRTSSVIAAARFATRDHESALCVLPVDHPRIDSDLLQALLQEWQLQGAPTSGWLAPGLTTKSGLTPGHPVFIGAALVKQMLADSPAWQTRPLRDLRAAAKTAWMLPTDNTAVTENLDRPADLEAICRMDQIQT